jgi:hypothetical protein
MTVYTIFAADGRELSKLSSVEEAAIEMLTQYGHHFEIRRVKDGYRSFRHASIRGTRPPYRMAALRRHRLAIRPSLQHLMFSDLR